MAVSEPRRCMPRMMMHSQMERRIIEAIEAREKRIIDAIQSGEPVVMEPLVHEPSPPESYEADDAPVPPMMHPSSGRAGFDCVPMPMSPQEEVCCGAAYGV